MKTGVDGDAVEGGWVLEGSDGDGRPVRLTFGDTELAKAYLGLAVGRHPSLCERVIADPTVSRRHVRIGLANGRPFVEDLNSLNGTVVDGQEIRCFQPVPLAAGQKLSLGRVTLTVSRLAGGSGQ
jgi:pSer/pThr/pTyr-binding forkhead associated (FHA) protein